MITPTGGNVPPGMALTGGRMRTRRSRRNKRKTRKTRNTRKQYKRRRT
jgi:hypothetical protein